MSGMIKRPLLVGLFLILCLFLNYRIIHAQEKTPSGVLVSINVTNASLISILQFIEQQTTFKFAYKTDLITQQDKISLKVNDLPLSELLTLVFKGTNISFSFIGNQIVLQEIYPLKRITFNGFVTDSASGESLAGALIYLPSLKTGTYSNSYSFYSISVNPTDSLEIIIYYIGYKHLRLKVNARVNFTANFNLVQTDSQLEQIIVTKDKKDDNLKIHQLGKTEISSEMINTVPSINSNGDLINSIQMLPGIVAGIDGVSGYYVRGGNSDQNMVLLDEAALYNPNHLFGLVSIFNSSAIKSATFFKGAFPASYGGHLSSILDVSMKDGNSHQFGGEILAGTIATGFTLYGPIVPDKASFLLSARRSTIDILLRPLHIKNYYSDYYFYDLNSKLNFQLSQKDRIYLSLYLGRDISSFSPDTTDNSAINYGTNFGNQALTFRWNHLFSPKFFSNSSIIYSNYHQSLTAIQQQYYANLYSGIRDLNIKTDLYYYPNPIHKINAGFSYLYQTQVPALVSDKIITNGSIIKIVPSDIPKKFMNLASVYLSDNIILNQKLIIYMGVRFPVFYNDNSRYFNIEPRLSVIYLVNHSTSLKLSYTRMHQYVHLVQSFNASFPAELWIGSSKNVKPQNSQQISTGIFKNFNENMFQSSIELYYKHMGNQMLFKGGYQPAINNNLENTLVFGQGQSCGAEFFFRKSSGKITGWLAYTLSCAFQQFDSLNLGEKFSFSNDRRHCIYASASYAINQHWEISLNFLFTTGRAFTLNSTVSDSLNQNQDSDPLFDEENNDDGSNNGSGSLSQSVQNNFRLTPYNRLDFSISYHKKKVLPKRITETEWALSIYNIYARHNTFFAYRSIDPVTKQPIANQVSFIPLIVSISYAYRF
jgi:hypothetical protein